MLPYCQRNSVIVNNTEIRLYYCPDQKKVRALKVLTYPLGVVRQGWDTPYIDTKIIQKKKNPYWYPPESIRAVYEERGDPLPKRVAPGPDNPLGDYALRLGLPQYLIHGTNKPYGIGMRVSPGCIRLYPEDIGSFFIKVQGSNPVCIINQPYKFGNRL